ncbi:MAG: hypothetical protein ACLU38_03955 [Dysosmobacter sp.]
MLDANGNWVTDPDHVTLIFTVTTTTPTAEVMTTKVGDQESPHRQDRLYPQERVYRIF